MSRGQVKMRENVNISVPLFDYPWCVFFESVSNYNARQDASVARCGDLVPLVIQKGVVSAWLARANH